MARRAFAWLLGFISLLLLAMLATVPLDWRDQAIFSFCTLVAALIVDRFLPAQTGTLTLVALSVFSTIRYAIWRFGETWQYLKVNGIESLGIDIVFVALLLGAECYAIVILLLGYFQAARPLQRRPVPLPEDAASWPTVDIFVPTYNEPLEVVRATVLGALNIDWPEHKRRVHILDDGTRPEFEDFAKECGAGYIIRARHVHAKAGNINNALKQTDGEFVVIFDADHVATRSFLQMTMGWFLHDPKLAMLQTPHHFYSPDPFERNLNLFRKVSNEGSLFYGVVQDGNDLWNATFFCGSCAVIRRRALEEVGGIAVETVTEDAHTSLRLQKGGWNTAYLAIPQAAGLATANLAEHIGQRIRWARGMVQILRLENPLFTRGLKWPQRLCYFNAVAHFLFALPRLIFLTAPLLYLLFNVSNILGYVVAILMYALPHLFMATITNSRIQGRHRLSFWNEIYETVLAPYILLPTLAALISPRWGKFNVTPKSTKVDQTFFDWRVSAPYLVLVAMVLAGIINGVFRMKAEPEVAGTLAINIAWCVLNLVTLGGAIAVAQERAQRRNKARIDTSLPCELRFSGAAHSTHTLNISESGLAIEMPAGLRLQPGERGTVRFPLFDGTIDLPIEVIVPLKGTLRASFMIESVAQAEAVTRVVYGRADAWLDWKTGPDDRPLHSFFHILWVSLCGYAAVIRAMFTGRTRRAAAAAVLLAAALFSASRLHAAPASDAPAPSFSDTVDLRSLGLREPPLLHGSEGQASIRFHIPVTKITTDATLTLQFRPSAAIAGDGFALHVSLNGAEVGTVPTRATSGAHATANLVLPSDLLLSENQLAFRISANCVACPADVITQDTYVDLNTAIRMSGVLMPLANDLRLLPAPFFDPSSRYKTRLPFVLPAHPDNRTLEAAGVVASWFGMLADHRGMQFPVSSETLPAGNAVVLVRAGSPLAEDLGLGEGGPLVAIRDNPADPHGRLLVLYGATSGQLLTAAKAIALHASDLQGDRASVSAKHADSAPRGLNDAPRWVNTKAPITLGSLTTADSLRVAGNGSARLYFRLPPDLYYGSRATVPLRLAYRYSQLAPGTKANLQVRMNGIQVSLLSVPARESGKVQHAMLQVPVSLLYPRNTLDLDFRYQASPGSTAPPTAQVLPTSALDLTDVSTFTALPRLDLFAKAGFPFTRRADLRETAVVLASNATPEQTGLYLDLMGFLGAQTGHPAVAVRVIEAREAASVDRDLLVIGAGNESLPAILGSAPLTMRQGAFRPTEAGGLQQLDSLGWTRSGREQDRLFDALAGDAPDAILQGYASRVRNGRSVVTIAAPTLAGSETFVEGLAAAAQTVQVAGSVSVYQNGKFQSFHIGRDDAYLGSLGSWEMFHYLVARQFLWMPVVIVLLALVLGSLSHQWLERRAALRVKVQ
ncbi:MAG: UDP-forming cellulose synthase catalytic subunit [Bryobacterales bacterium]|nr:UDP-forming cellulose synthase catalytic subunit [Bryobacterales bacterium]